jgi:bleomycin hydrolase
MKTIILSLIFLLSAFLTAFPQEKNKSTFRAYKPGFYENSIMKDARFMDEQKAPGELSKRFQVDMTGLDLPNKLNLYKSPVWHFPPVSQGNTGTCWCFSTTSFYESEVYRLTGQKIKLSEIHTVYWEYVEKARRFIKMRGNSAFEEGSEANAVTREFKTYGAVPEEFFTGLLDGRKYHNHETMFKEMKAFLNSLLVSNAWNEDFALATIKSILNKYLGEPPSQFSWNGKIYSPKQFLSEVLKLKMEDYVDILSYKQEPYWQMADYKVGDNWWHSKDYYNIPLDDFMAAVKNAIRKGFTFSIGGDVSEAGLSRDTQCALIPSFDIPSAFIDDDARQFRFSNGSTSDDHGLHLVGFTEKNGKDWFLIKDSGSGSKNGDEKAPEFGYYFFHEDYVKLKMMNFTIHKDAVKDILKKFSK